MEIKIEGKSVHVSESSVHDVKSVLSLVKEILEQEVESSELQEPWPEATLVDGLYISIRTIQFVEDKFEAY
jgi:hypothetical protein